MEYKFLGKTKEKISAVGLGSWELGSTREEVDALKAGIDAGINLIDTAEMYGTEPVVAKAIKENDEIFLATKVSPTHFHYEDVIKSCEASLRKLGVKRIDLYQLHWPNPYVKIEETMRAMEKLVEDGRIRYIGVSNFSVKEMKAAQEALKKNEVVSNQVEYSVLVRDIEKEILDYCRKEKITVIAYSPLSRGQIFKSKYSRLKDLLDQIGKKHGKSAAEVALNWLIEKEPVVAIPKASSREHVKEIVGACDWRMSKEELNSINSFLSEDGA